MTPKGFPDPEYPADLSAQGQRKDNRHLINEWLSMKEGKVKINSLMGNISFTFSEKETQKAGL